MFRRGTPLLRLAASAYAAAPTAEPKPLEQTIAEHKAVGEDVTENLTNDFIASNFAVISYRIKKLGTEWEIFRANPTANLPGASDFLIHGVGLIVIFVLMFWLGRQSMTPLIPPPTEVKPQIPSASEKEA